MKKNTAISSLCMIVTLLILTAGCKDADLPILISYSSIDGGDTYSVALKPDGSLWAWGYNYYGQLGDGTYDDKANQTFIGTGYASVNASGVHTLAIKSDGTLWAWGSNTSGQLG